MMQRRAFVLGLGALGVATALTLGVARAVQSSRHKPRILTTTESAYLLGVSEPVLLRKVEEVSPAPMGRYALVRQDLRPDPTDEVKEPFGEEKLWLYDSKTRRTTLLARTQDDPEQKITRSCSTVAWFPKTKRAVVSTVTRIPRTAAAIQADKDGLPYDIKTQFGIVDVDRPNVRWLQLPAEFAAASWYLQIEMIMGLESIAFQHDDSKLKRHYVSFLRSDGTFSRVFTLPFTKRSLSVHGLSEDGKQLYFVEPNFERIDAGFLQKNLWSALTLADGTVTPLSEKPKRIIENNATRDAEAPRGLLQLSDDQGRLTGANNRKAGVHSLWLERRGEKPATDKDNRYARALITADFNGNAQTLLSDNSAVLYTHEEVLYATPITTLDLAAFAKLQREMALSNGKQVGLALMMYAMDYDENFPNDPSLVKDSVFPYLKDENILADFVYTYKGDTNLTKIAEPATTELGSISLPGGRIVVFADGHVKFVADGTP